MNFKMELEKEAWEIFSRTFITNVKDPKLRLLKNIFRSFMSLCNDCVETLDLKITEATLRELVLSFKVFYKYKTIPKITIFGSSRVEKKSEIYLLAKNFALAATQAGYMIITGGGPGVMEAGNEGAGEKSSFGLNILLPQEQTTNPYVDRKNKLIYYKYFFTRKIFLVKEACAFVFFPGGFGTFDEAFEVLTLLQSGKVGPIPVVMLEPKEFGFWSAFRIFLKKTMERNQFISPFDQSLFYVTNSHIDAVKHISNFYKNFHSIRFVNGKLVIRLKRVLDQKTLNDIRIDFEDILVGELQQRGELDEEKNEPEISALPRLVIDFNRKDYSRLRCLIDFINTRGG